MKLHCHKNSLIAAFQVVNGVIPSRTPKEILRNVKIEARDGSVTLSGTDQEVGIRYNVPGVEIEVPGETLLPTARMISILRELSDSSVDLELTDGGVQIRSGQSDFHLATEDPAEFPPIAEFEAENYLTISGNLLREAIRRTVFATDTESTRYALGGVLLELEADSFTLVATDSRRLAVMKSACKAVGDV